MIILTTHPIGHEYTSEATGAEKFHLVRLNGVSGHLVKNVRVWALIHNKSASSKVNVYVKHAPASAFREFVPKGQTPKRRRLWRKSIQEGCDRRFGRIFRKDRDGPDRRLWVPPLSVPAAAPAPQPFARCATHSV